MGGFISQLVNSFTGKGAEDKLNQGIGAVGAGRDSAVGAYKQAGDQAQGYMQPYRDPKAFNTYRDTLGVNGAGARGAAEDLYNSDDMLAKQRAYDLSRSGRQQNASAALADSRVRMQGYGDWQNRLGAAGQQEQGAAGTSGGMALQTGAGVAGAYSGAAGQTANLYQQEATNANTLAQNTIGAGAVLGSLATGVPMGRPPGSNNLGYQPGTAANGGWSTQTTAAQQPAWYNPSRYF